MNQLQSVLWAGISVGIAMAASAAPPAPGGSRVGIVGDATTGFKLLRNGSPFEIRGVGGDADLGLLADCGANCLRTWGADACDRDIGGRRMIDAAHQHGLAVTVGLWLGHRRHGFDWSDTEHLARQRRDVEAAVRGLRDHPAVLMWALGNEMENDGGPGDDPLIWAEVNRLAGLVKSLDPHHPVMTVVANVGEPKVAAINRLVPEVDLLGVNAYAGVGDVGDRLRRYGWQRPYCVTEFGIPGPWEVAVTDWQVPIEPSSAAKAETTAADLAAISADTARCLGTFAFYWGSKQEATASWFGLLLPSGEKTARVDVLARAWNGRWPSNRAPALVEADVPIAGRHAAGGRLIEARARYADPEGDPLAFHWEVRAESSDRRIGGDAEATPREVVGSVVDADDRGRVSFRTPVEPGPYRIFVTVRDGHGSGCMDNWPFYVDAHP